MNKNGISLFYGNKNLKYFLKLFPTHKTLHACTKHKILSSYIKCYSLLKYGNLLTVMTLITFEMRYSGCDFLRIITGSSAIYSLYSFHFPTKQLLFTGIPPPIIYFNYFTLVSVS